MFNSTKDAKYYYEEGVKKYLKGSKSALKYMQKALDLAQNDPETSNELFNNIYIGIFAYYNALFPDYSKALIYCDKVIDTNVSDVGIEKAKEFRAEVKANPDKFDEQTLLKCANQIRIMNEPDSKGILAYIKCLILFNNPKCDEIFYIVAQKMESYSRIDAERNIKQAIAINPNKQEYYDRYFSIIHHIVTDEYGEEDFAKTVKKYDKIMKDIIKKSISIKPTAQAYLNYYRYYSFLKDVKSAMKALDKAIALAPENAFMYEYRAELKRKNGDIDGAIKDYELALAIDPFEKFDYVEVANLYYEKFGKEKVYEYFDEKMSQFVSEKDLYPYFFLFKISFESEYGDYDLCLLNCDRAINLPQYTPEEKYSIYSIKAECLYKKGDYENALKALDYAIELEPSCAQIYMNKGDILSQQKKYEEAISCYKQAEEISLKIEGIILYNLCTTIGNCYESLGKYIDALKYYNKGIKKRRDYVNPYKKKIGLLIDFRKYKLALKWTEKAEKLFKSELDEGFYGNKGLICFHLKDYKNAVKNFKKYPQWSGGQILTAYIDFLQGNSKNALKKLDKIELTTPAEVNSKYSYITLIYYKNKEYDKVLETIAKMKDKDSFYYYLKSVIYKELGDSTSAEENLNMTKSTLEENETMENLIRKIEEAYQIKFN